MPSALPLVEDSPGQAPSLWSVGGQASALGTGVQGSASMNYGEGAGSENTHLWVAGVMIVALVIVVALHVSGFRFATDVGITRG